MMQNKRIIAITGIIGSGKSAVSAILKKWGAVTFSCDEINAEMFQDPSYLIRLSSLFPDAVQGGLVDKKMIASVIFSDSNKRMELNALSHPEIMRRLLTKIENCTFPVIFVEVPLLFGTPFENLFSEIIYVTCKKDIQIERICRRDGIDRISAEKKIISQKEISPVCAKKVYFIDNSSTFENLEIQLKQFFSK